MNKKVAITAYDILAKLLLVWFIFETFLYFYTGRFWEQISGLSSFGNYSILLDIYTFFQIPVSAIGAIIFIPLVLKGFKSGLILGIFYWVMGYSMNPLWYAMPRSMQVTPEGKATSLLTVINLSWAAFTLLVLITYFFYRREQMKIAVNK